MADSEHEVAVYCTSIPRIACGYCGTVTGYSCDLCHKQVCPDCFQDHTDWHWRGRKEVSNG